MKKIVFTGLITLHCFLAYGQSEALKFKDKELHNNYLSYKELKDQFIHYNFSVIFNQIENSMVYGFIGNNYQRIRIKFISVTKSQSSTDTYNISGKSMAKNNIDEFHGTIKISNVRKYKLTSYGVDDEYKNKGIKGQFVILGDYALYENKTHKYSGIFKGTFKSGFYLDKNNVIHYDNLNLASDSYANNQFVGQWLSYKNDIIKNCNWGDYRIPNSGDLDIGAGDFSPNDKYLKYGWQNLRDLSTNLKSKKARQTENRQWWR